MFDFPALCAFLCSLFVCGAEQTQLSLDEYSPLLQGISEIGSVSTSKMTASSIPSSKPRPAKLTRTENEAAIKAIQHLLPKYASDPESRSKQDELFPKPTQSQRRIMNEAARRQYYGALHAEMDEVQEIVSSIGTEHELWAWICENVFENNTSIVDSPNYPELINFLFGELPPRLALALFHVTATISPASFVSGCNPKLFNALLRMKWSEWYDVSGVAESLSQMLDAGIAPVQDTIMLAKEIRLALDTDWEKAEQEAKAALVSAGTRLEDVTAEQLKTETEARARFVPAERQAARTIDELLAYSTTPTEAAMDMKNQPRNRIRRFNDGLFGSKQTHRDRDRPKRAHGAASNAMAFDQWLRDTDTLAKSQGGEEKSVPPRPAHSN